MRVTANTFPADLIRHLGSLAGQQTRLHTQASTGQRIALPEDDPGGVGRAVALQSEAGAVAQYQRNIEHQQQTAQATFSLVQALKKISDRAGEIATLADGLKSPEQLRAYGAEITQLIRQTVQIANTSRDGQFLLAGTRSSQAPFALTEDADGSVAAVVYNGNASTNEVEIAEGMTLTSQVVGGNTTGTGPRGLLIDARAGADFFNHLISLQDHLLAGDAAGVAATDRPQLSRDEENFVFQIALNGALQERLQVAESQARQRKADLQQNLSREVDADLAQTLVRLSQTQTAYQAALQTGGSILSLSLLDYLR